MAQLAKLDSHSNWARDLDKVDDSWASQLSDVQDDTWARDLDPKPVQISPKPDVSAIASGLHRESVGEVVEEFPTTTVPTTGLRSVLGRDVGEVDLTQPGPLISDESKENFMNNLNRVWSLAKNPYDIIKGTAELLTAIPGFMLSTIPAMRSTFEKQQSHDTLLDLYNDFWEELEGNMAVWQKYVTGPVGRVFDTPRKVRDRLRKSLLGAEPEERRGDESEMIGEMFMAPYTVASGSIGEIADDSFFDDSPNWRGGIKIFGDAIGFAFMGSFYRGGRQALSRDLEPLVRKGVELKDRQTKIDNLPDEILKKAEQEILNMEKKQAELYAAEVMKKQDYDKMIKEDLSSKTTQIKQIKQPKREIADEVIDRALREKPGAERLFIDVPIEIKEGLVSGRLSPDLVVAAKDKAGKNYIGEKGELHYDLNVRYPGKEWTELGFADSSGKFLTRSEALKLVKEEIPAEFKEFVADGDLEAITYIAAKAKAEGIEFGKRDRSIIEPSVEEPRTFRTKREAEFDYELEELAKKKKEGRLKTEPTTDLDLQTGTREPIQLSTEKSPFRQKPKKTELLDGLMRDRKSVAKNVNELIDIDPNLPAKDINVTTTKLLNDINKWLDGKEVDVELTRNFLSELATRTEELRRLFESEADFVGWKDTISEAASWARRAKKEKVKQIIYRQGRPEGKWWTPDKEYAEIFGKKGKKIVEERLPSDVKLIDEVEFNKLRNEGESIDTALDRLNYDGLIRLEESMEGRQYTSYYLKDRLKIEQPGVELYSGIPLDKAAKEVLKLAKEFKDTFDKAIKAKDFDLTYAMKKLKIDSVQAALEQSETLMKHILKKYGEAGYRVVQRQRAAAAGSGYGRVIYDQIVKEVFEGKSPKMVDATNAYILARRFKDIYSYKSEEFYKHEKGYGAKQSTAYSEAVGILEKLTKEETAEVKRLGDAFFEHTKRMIDDAVIAEIKTPAEGELLKAHDFRKFKTLNVETLFDAVRKTKLGNRTIKATDSGIESLGHGSTKMLDPDARVSLMEMTGRLYGSAGNNVAKLAWRDLAEKYPDNSIVSMKSVHKWAPLPYFDKGVRKNLYFHPDAAKHLVLQSHDISRRFSKVAQWFFLAPVTRALAVGTSPAWATFVGFPMDVMHTLFTAKTFDVVKGKKVPIYGPFTPAYPFKLGVDLARTFYDTFHRGPLFRDYAKYGGMMPFLSQRQSRYLKGTKPPGQFAKFMDVMTYHGASMELWVRHAIADRVIRNRAKEQGITYEAARKNKDIMYEAVHAARERMDYNQGGWLVKAADQSGLIFLNAGVLGARKFWAAAKENPVDFTFKAAQIGIAATGITATAALLYPEIWKEIPKEGNERNITFPLFPNWISFIDRDGNDRHFYIKMRMDPGGAFFYKVFSTLTQTYLYDKGLIKEEPNYRDVVETLKLQLPIDTKFPPAAQMGIDYYTNYSWWKERKMYTEAGGKTFDWPKSAAEGIYDQDRGLRDPSISQLAADVGQITKLSPKRLQESIGNVFPRGNEFVYLFGKAYEVAFDDIPKEVRKEHFLMSLARFPGVNRFIGVTVPEYDRRVRRDEAAEDELLETVIRNGELDSITKAYYWHGAGSYKDVAGVLAKQKDLDIFESMEKRVKFIEDVKDLGHRNYWVSMYHATPKAKARDYVETYNRASVQERKELLLERAELDAIGGYITDKFLEEEAKLEMYGPTPKIRRE